MRGQLTEKQRLFADMVLKGSTLSHSYVSVYAGGDGSRKATKGQANQASKVWRSPPIQAYADAARAHVENNRARRALGTRERIERQLWVEADGEKSADRLRALELLGKSIGLYREHVEIEAVESLGAAEIEAELRALITAALPAALDLPPGQVPPGHLPNGNLPNGNLPTGREADDSDPEVERLE